MVVLWYGLGVGGTNIRWEQKHNDISEYFPPQQRSIRPRTL